MRSLIEHVDDRVLEDPGAAAAGSRRGERRRSGASGCRCCRCRSTRSGWRADGVTLEQVMTVTADALDAGLLQYSRRRGDRHRRVHRDAEPAARHPARAADRRPRRTSPRCRSTSVDGKPLRLGDVADVVEDHQPLIGDAVINDGEGLMLIVEKLPWGNTLEVTEGVEAALDELAPGLSGIEIDTDDLPAGDLRRDGARQPVPGAAARLSCSWSMVLGAVPLPVAHRADQPRRDPAVAGRGRAGALPARGTTDQHDGPRRAGDRRRRGGRRRHHRHREHRATPAPGTGAEGGQRSHGAGHPRGLARGARRRSSTRP